MKRVFCGVGALFCSWAGLGMLGVVSGWSNTDTMFAKLLGVCFLIVGFKLVRYVIEPTGSTTEPGGESQDGEG